MRLIMRRKDRAGEADTINGTRYVTRLPFIFVIISKQLFPDAVGCAAATTAVHCEALGFP